MVVDSKSSQRSKDVRGGNNSRKKPGISTVESSPVSDSAKTGSPSLRRSTRSTTSREQNPSTSSETPPGKESSSVHSSKRKSERLDKKDIPPLVKKKLEVMKKDKTPPVKRKLEVMEKKLTSSSLRRSDRGKKQLSSSSPDSDNNAKKLKRVKSVNQLTLEAIEVKEATVEPKRPNGQLIKRMNGRTFKSLFRQQRRRESAPNSEKELENKEKLSQDDKSCLGVDVCASVEVGEDGVVERSEKIEEESVERDTPIETLQVNGANAFHGSTIGEELIDDSVSSQVGHTTVEVQEDGVVELSEKIEEESVEKDTPIETLQVNGANAFHGSTIGEELIDDSVSSQVGHTSVVELQCPEVEILPDSNVVEVTIVVPSSSSECDKDNFVVTCAQCCKRRRLGNNSVAQELCSCDHTPMSDLRETFISEDRVELALCNDPLNDAVNDGDTNMNTSCKLDGNLTPDSSRFIEYWVPVSTSNVQLEQYCSTLLQNSTTLRSSLLKGIVGSALHDILITTKKCCDHPYFVDSKLQAVLTENIPPIEYLDVGIKASGKFQLLDTVLPEIKRRGKRVLILYQSIRPAAMLTGDILDDFVRQRFGEDSYERVDKGISEKKKQAALNKFNAQHSGIFVFLLEKQACSATIRLSSVDAVVLFDSDWNPMNDYRALQKLSIDSSPEPIKIFRLYTSCTLEEKVLDLAANHVTFDSHHISRTTSHMLLMWGASYLFSKLKEFHSSNPSKDGTSLSSDTPMLKDVARELLELFMQNSENSCTNSLITKVRVTKETYSKTASLFGELKVYPFDGKEPHLFWNQLLEFKNPQWKFLSGCSQRNRKRAQHFGELPPDDVKKKQKKIVNNSTDAVSPRTRCREGGSGVVSPKSTAPLLFSSYHISSESEAPKANLEEGIKLRDLQKNLHGHLKFAISELTETLKLPENVKTVGEIFLEYIVDNHQIVSEPSILQAFQITLVWVAASLVRYQIDKKQSLDEARQLLGFHCTEEEVNSVHLKLRELKEKFKEMSLHFKEPEPTKDLSDDRLKQILKKCKKRKSKLLRRHEVEKQELNRIWEEEKVDMENQHRIDSAVVRNIYHNQAVRLERLKKLDEAFVKKMDVHKCEKELRLQKLKGKQLDEINEEDQKAESWLTGIAPSGPLEQPVTLSERVGPSENKFHDGQENVGFFSREKNQSPNRTEMTKVATTIPMTTARENTGCGVTSENSTVPSQSPAICDLPSVAENISDEAPCAQETDVEFSQVDIERIHINISDPDLVENCNEPSIIIMDTDKENDEGGATIEIPSVGTQKSIFRTDPDGAPSGAVEKDATAANEFSGGAKSLKPSNFDGEYDKNNSKNNDLSNPTPVQDSHNTSGTTASDGNASKEIPLVTSPAVQTLVTRVQDVVSSQNIAPQDECTRQSTSAGILQEDTISREQAEVDILHSNNAETESMVLHDGDTHANIRYNVPDTIEGSLLSAPPIPEQTDHHLCHVEHPPSQNGGKSPVESVGNRVPSLSTQIVDEVMNDEAAPQMAPPCPELTENHLPHVEHPPSVNGENSTLESGENPPLQLSTQITDDVLNHDGSLMGIPPPSDTPVAGFMPHHPPRHTQHMNPRTQLQPLLSDPLQIELERLHKETEEVNRSFEDVKVQLKSDYEKRVEEVMAELRRRFETKLRSVEAEHLSKKKELDANHNKVFMNRILAEAFRTKCLEFRPSVSSGMCQVPSTNFLHQLLMLSRHPQRKSAVSPSPNLAPSSPNLVPPSPNLVPPSPNLVPPSPNLGPPSPNLVPPAVAQQTAVPRPSPTITTMGMRQHRPLVNTQHPIGNFPVSGSIRATAPHLRPSLPPSNFSANQGLPGQDSQRQPQQVPFRMPTTLPLQQSPMQQPCLPIHHVENLPASLPPNVLPHVPDSGTNFVGLHLSPGGERVSGRVNLSQPSVMSDVVYLSDDE